MRSPRCKAWGIGSLACCRRTALRWGSATTCRPSATPFVGRASALTGVRERLGAARLVTLVGIGGIGKTRLALRLAARAVDEMPDGAWWVDLGPNDDPSRVAASIAQALGCRIDPKASARQALVDHLRSRRLLLVLDNCEHVLEAAAREIEALLDAAPGLLVLTTSREALGLPGETVMPVRPLETPTAQSPLAAMDGFESVRLFLQAAVQAHPDFVLDDANAADIAAICREVDGLPLAVELAAAQMQVLAPHQLLQVLRERFEVLGGPRRALPRQQTLRTIINWSWQNLGPMEQGLLCAVAGCAGGGDLDAVVGLADPRSSTAEAVCGLARLADLSLITVVHGATAARYRVLETVSQFVVEKLTDCGELAALRDRHLAHFCRRTTGWGCDWGGPHDARALADADLNHENVARAIDWALSRHQWQDAATLTAHLFPWWTARTGAALGLEQTDAVLAIAPADAGGEALADLCGQASAQALRRGDIVRARAYATHLLGIAARDGNHTKQLDARIQLARCDDREGHSTLARQALEAVVADARSQALPVVLGDALNVLGLVQWTGGDLPGARLTFSESALLGRGLGRRYDAVIDTLNLAGIELECGDARAARQWLSAVAGERASTNHRYVDQMWLDLAAWLAAVEADWARTVRGIRLAERLAASLHHGRSPHWVGLRERCLAQARAALGAAGFEAAWAQGDAVSLQAALAQADAWLSRGDTTGHDE